MDTALQAWPGTFRSVSDGTGDWDGVLAVFLKPTENRMRLHKKDSGSTESTTARRDVVGRECRNGRLEGCVQQRGALSGEVPLTSSPGYGRGFM